jgi:HEPN domain-containing protein
MRNRDLSADYVHRASIRLRALDVLYDAESWADVVRESQEIVELALKGLLRACGVEPPRVHDVSDVLRLERAQLPAAVLPELDHLAEISRRLRRDRELAYYGAEDLTPSGFYRREDATSARADAALVVRVVRPVVITPGAITPPPAAG